MTTIKDVAAHVGVSAATVSRVLSGKGNVHPETQQLVLDAVAELNYRPNRIASSLRKQRSNVIGLLVSDIRNPFFTAMARAIEDFANPQDLSVFLCNTDEDPLKERRYINTLLDESVSGMILSPTSSQRTHFKPLLDTATPVVLIDRRIEGVDVDCVLGNNEAAAADLTAHLVAQGYRRIAAVIGLKNSTTGRERMSGYQRIMAQHGLEPIAVYTPPTEAESAQAVEDWLTAEVRPEAIITGNSRLTLGVLNALKRHGLRAPDDIALAGFDETPWSPHVASGLTVISQPTYEMGRTAAEMLLERLAEPERPTREVTLRGTLIVRGSTPPRIQGSA